MNTPRPYKSAIDDAVKCCTARGVGQHDILFTDLADALKALQILVEGLNQRIKLLEKGR